MEHQHNNRTGNHSSSHTNSHSGSHTDSHSSGSTSLRTYSPADRATLFLRLFIGVVLFTEAITKSQQYPLLEGEYPSLWGLSPSSVVSIVGIVELVAGLLLTVGALTRLTAIVMTCLMLGAAFIYFPMQSFSQAELKVVYAGIYITLAISGGGRYSLDTIIFSLRGGRSWIVG